MNVSALTLQNFRGFEAETIELRPLTVLLGPNSAGKSAFAHALAAMSHAHRTFAPTPQATLTPPNHAVEDWPVDLGNTTNLRRVGSDGPVKIGLWLPDGEIEYGFGGLKISDKLQLSSIRYPSSQTQTYRNVPSSETLTAGIAGNMSAETAVAASTIDDRVHIVRLNEQDWEIGGKRVTMGLSGLALLSVNPGTSITQTDQVDSVTVRTLESFFQNLTYLRAIRSRPLRSYRDVFDAGMRLGYSGQFAPSVLFNNRTAQTRFSVPPALPDDKNPSVEYPGPWHNRVMALADAISFWMSHLGLALSIESRMWEGPGRELELVVALDSLSSRNITEVGLGVSQVLPVILGGLTQSEESIYVVDLPEAHLHPLPQSLLADFFCSIAMSGKTSLVETHSEMFFHRLRLQAAMSPTLKDMIAVYFIDAAQDGRCAKPRRVGLDFDDEIKWPPTFLEEAWRIEMQIGRVRKLQEANDQPAA